MDAPNTVETIGGWTTQQLREAVLEVVRSIQPERDFYAEFEDSTAGRVVKIEAELSSLKELTLRGFAEQEKRFLAELGSVRSEVGSLRSEMQAELGSLRSEMLAELGSVRSEVGSLRSEMQAEVGSVRSEVGSLRSEMLAEIRGLARWIKTSLAVLVPLILAVLGFSINLAIRL